MERLKKISVWLQKYWVWVAFPLAIAVILLIYMMSDFFPRLNEENISVLINAILVVVTIFYVVLTRKTVQLLQAQVDNQIRPQVIVYLGRSSSEVKDFYATWSIFIKNIGTQPAYNITFKGHETIHSIMGRANSTDDSTPTVLRGLNKCPTLTEGISFLAPQQQIEIGWGGQKAITDNYPIVTIFHTYSGPAGKKYDDNNKSILNIEVAAGAIESEK